MGVRERTGQVLSGWFKLPVERPLPQGLYLPRDIRRLLPNLKVEQVFDVGANIGQMAVQYSICYPNARIDCFEPVPDTFDELVVRVGTKRNVNCHRMALGEDQGYVTMATGDASDRLRIDAEGTEQVPVSTVDKVAADYGIGRINLLKVDTEGYDLKVLRGADKMIEEQLIDVIQVEAGMYPENELHVYFEDFTSYMHERDYRILGVYEQMREWKHGLPNLRRANIAFASRAALDANRS